MSVMDTPAKYPAAAVASDDSFYCGRSNLWSVTKQTSLVRDNNIP